MFKWLKRLFHKQSNLERLKESKANENQFLFKQNKFYCQFPNCGFVTEKRGATIYHALIHCILWFWKPLTSVGGGKNPLQFNIF